MDPKRVLIGGFTHNVGGMEIYIMEIYRHMDRTKVQFDFLNIEFEKLAFEDEILELGGKIIKLPTIVGDNRNRKRILHDLFSKTKYVAVYFQFNRKPVNFDVFRIAKAYGVKKCIIHSHNSEDHVKGIAYRILSKVNRPLIYHYVDTRFACSKQAGKWMFGNRDFKVINNCVNTDKFKFNVDDRRTIRRELDISPKSFVVGTVARLSEVKNPDFLIRYFMKLQQTCEDVYLVHVGGGELFDEIQESIKKNNIANRFFLLGQRNDINKVLSAMDLFVLPSIHEGFPISLVEAQCSGLPCVVSDNVTTDCNITGKICYVSLDDLDEWINQTMMNHNKDAKYRETAYSLVKEKEYDLMQLVKNMEDMFYSL